jgi:DNA-binding response OmpR family regulator
VTLQSETDSKVKLLDAGADDYINKPFSFRELLSRIRALLRRPHRIEGEMLCVDDLKLNTKSHIVLRGAKDLYLTRKEFMLLEFLMRNQGDVMSRGMLNEHVWDNEADPFSKTIESHILSLRRKINFNGKKKLIETLPGRGYKI